MHWEPPVCSASRHSKSLERETVERLETEMGLSLNRHCNLYIYFLCLALLKSHSNGLVALIIPYEWVSRPSAKAVREFIRKQRWNVSVYRFQMPIFEGVMTTASISLVDKSVRKDQWAYYDIKPDYTFAPGEASRVAVIQFLSIQSAAVSGASWVKSWLPRDFYTYRGAASPPWPEQA